MKKQGNNLLKKSANIHFVGIGGIGMSAIAEFMKYLGFRVTGSDKNTTGHKAQNVKGADYVIYSSAISADNIELLTAKKNNIPILHRSEVLSFILDSKHSYLVAGTHGKSTTSSMLAYLTEDAAILGAHLPNLNGLNYRAAKSKHFIAEIDESDGSIVNYKGKNNIAIITNIEYEHVEHYKTEQQLIDTFLEFSNNNEITLLNNDDANCKKIFDQTNSLAFTFGINNPSFIMARNIEGSSYDLFIDGSFVKRVTLSVGGKHNIYNSLAAFGALYLTKRKVEYDLSNFKLPKRRFDILLEKDNLIVVDDYAHHPTEIKAVFDIAKQQYPAHKLICAFVPHRMTRYNQFKKEFIQALSVSDFNYIFNIDCPVSGKSNLSKEISDELSNSIFVGDKLSAKLLTTPEKKIIIVMGPTARHISEKLADVLKN